MNERVTILGAGSWGMAIARLLHANGCAVNLWEYDPPVYRKLETDRSVPTRLDGFRIPDGVHIANNLNEAVRDCTLLVIAIPAQFVRDSLRQLKSSPKHVQGIVNLAKGIELGTLQRMSEVIHHTTDIAYEKIATLSGPSHAEEVIKDMPTTVVVAGYAQSFVAQVQATFSSGSFRVYTSNDLVGVELGGALKNIIAIAAGIADGLGFGDNTKGALMTRGLAEITRLGLAMGARAETFAGLSGLGDLITTCISQHSRNRYVGEKIGRGETLQHILSGMTMVAEGVATASAALALSRQQSVEMPITAEICQVLFEGKRPTEAVERLMGRTLKAEIWQ